MTTAIPKAYRDERAAAMLRLYQSGLTLSQIGDAYGMTRERVRQIIGRNRNAGGMTARTISRCAAREHQWARRVDERTALTYGCTRDLLLELNGGQNPSIPGCRAIRYLQQKKNADKRGIGWNISFPDWCRVWTESGKEHLRGRKADSYVMARIGDSGAYEIGNVEIVTAAQNLRDGYIAHPHAERFPLANMRDELGLTKRQREFLEAAKRFNCDSARIAAELGISKSSTKQHLCALRNRGLLPRPAEALKTQEAA